MYMTEIIIISNVVFHKYCTAKLSKNCQKEERKVIKDGPPVLDLEIYFTPRQTMSVYANVIDLKILTFFT